jgi:hypothetical protein
LGKNAAGRYAALMMIRFRSQRCASAAAYAGERRACLLARKFFHSPRHQAVESVNRCIPQHFFFDSMSRRAFSTSILSPRPIPSAPPPPHRTFIVPRRLSTPHSRAAAADGTLKLG